jgi:type I restriction enzyme, S subunit
MNWPLRSINEIGLVSRGRSRHRPRDAEHLYGGPYPFIQTGDVKHSDLYITQYTQTYSDGGLAQSKLWPTGTLCITIAANIADTAILAFDACFPDSIIGFIADPRMSDARFIKYLFDATLQKRFQRFTQGATQDNLSEAKLLSLKFPVPADVILQARIAGVLSAYDNLIEKNRRRIHLLEESARQLYQEWFFSKSARASHRGRAADVSSAT